MNTKTINELFDETKQKMNGHTMLFYFHLSNLCITADPMALLSATVKIENQELNLEDVASVSIPNDKQFAVLPKEHDYLLPILRRPPMLLPRSRPSRRRRLVRLTISKRWISAFRPSLRPRRLPRPRSCSA